MAYTLQAGPWQVACAPEDGGRLAALRYDGVDLLTGPPAAFRPTTRDFGRYETRPVYGYDDCFPTVDACAWPGGGWQVPDHGELCWLPATVTQTAADRVETVFESQAMPVRFVRALAFGPASLRWVFRVENRGDQALPFLHVMHALLPVAGVTVRRLPGFAACVDEVTGQTLACRTPEDVAAQLRATQAAARMLLLRGVTDGRVQFDLRGLRIGIVFPAALFPTLGIWWNAGGYPDEEGARRSECAFEPLAGPCSSLAVCHAAGAATMAAPAHGAVAWTIEWHVGNYASEENEHRPLITTRAEDR